MPTSVHGANQAPSTAAADTEDEVDPVALAALMIEDKHFDRAKAVLESVNLKKPPANFDPARFHMLHGLTLLSLGEYKPATITLKKSVAAGQQDKVVYVFLAQAYYHIEQYKEAVAALEKAGDEAEKLPGVFLLGAECRWRSKDLIGAYRVLERGIKKFPDDDAIKKAKILLLVDLGLYREAVDEGMRYLSQQGKSADEYVALAEALLKGKQYDKAALLLESARLRFTDDPNLLIQLAKAYLENGHTLIGARLFEHASNISPKLTADAAELYRRAGRPTTAIRLNAKIEDQKVKIRQRLGLLIETERFEEAAALLPRLERLGLLGEDDVVYGVAYAMFMVGRFDEAERYLKKIKDSKLFDKAVQLRRIMGTCAADGRQCP